MSRFEFPNDLLPDTKFENKLLFDSNYIPIKDIRLEAPMYFNQAIIFAWGEKDAFCAWTKYTDQATGQIFWGQPYDTYYFEIVQNMARKYGKENIYNIIRRLYDDVVVRPKNETRCSPIEYNTIQKIYATAQDYGPDAGWICNMLMHLYYGMVAEENKAHSMLGKSIKLNGVYDLIIAGKDIKDAANNTRNKKARDIQAECLRKNIPCPYHYRPDNVDIWNPVTTQ